MIDNSKSGFTLIEIAIVLIIITVVLGYTVSMVPVQQDLKQNKEAAAELDRIINSLYAFAQVNSYLPCPADNAISNGFECRDGDGDDIADGNCDGGVLNTQSCDVWFGFLPGKTLGFVGDYNANGLLVDPWGMPYLYQVSGTSGVGGPLLRDFVVTGGMQDEGMATLNPDLTVCNLDPSGGAQGNDTGCVDASETVATNLPAVVLSIGKDKAREGDVPEPSWVQRENQDNSLVDRVFIKTTRSDVTGSEYDDLVRWISPNLLFSKMIDAGQLP